MENKNPTYRKYPPLKCKRCGSTRVVYANRRAYCIACREGKRPLLTFYGDTEQLNHLYFENAEGGIRRRALAIEESRHLFSDYLALNSVISPLERYCCERFIETGNLSLVIRGMQREFDQNLTRYQVSQLLKKHGQRYRRWCEMRSRASERTAGPLSSWIRGLDYGDRISLRKLYQLRSDCLKQRIRQDLEWVEYLDRLIGRRVRGGR